MPRRLVVASGRSGLAQLEHRRLDFDRQDSLAPCGCFHNSWESGCFGRSSPGKSEQGNMPVREGALLQDIAEASVW